MKKYWLLILGACLLTLTLGAMPAAAKTPVTPQSFKTGTKYGHYRRYTKKLPKNIKGTWYTRSNKHHKYYDKINFKTYKSITITRQTSNISYDIYNQIDKARWGTKLFYNGHWFYLSGMASLNMYRVKKMKVNGKKQNVLLEYGQGQTRYFLRHKVAKMYTYPDHLAPDAKLQ